jgi:hypothetical protein
MAQITIQDIRKKKLSKSYAQLLGELRDLVRKTGTVYVPQLCEALAVENPLMSNIEVRNRVHLDLEGIWTRGSIETFFPSWVLRPGSVAGAKKGWETRNARKLQTLKKISETFEKVELPPPPAMPTPRQAASDITGEEFEEIEETGISEEMDSKLAEIGMGRFGSQGKTLYSVLAEINGGLARVFKGLTEAKVMPTVEDDLLVDFIRPTREFRKSLALELDSRHRTTLHNWCHYASVVIEDMIEQIKAAEEK